MSKKDKELREVIKMHLSLWRPRFYNELHENDYEELINIVLELIKQREKQNDKS